MTFAILCGGGGFMVGRYLLTERIANLESRIAKRDEEDRGPEGQTDMPRVLSLPWCLYSARSWFDPPEPLNFHRPAHSGPGQAEKVKGEDAAELDYRETGKPAHIRRE